MSGRGAGQPSNVGVPEGYHVAERDGRLWVWSSEAAELVRRARERESTLFEVAASHAEAGRMTGRGPVYRLPREGGDLVVRHYWRGGAVARFLGDRYLRVGTPRPIRELRASHAVRERGIATPKVVALAVYPDGVVYRADLVSVYVPDAIDLAHALFGPDACFEGDARRSAWRAAGRLVGGLHEGGVVHADLNIKNILLRRSTDPLRAYILDLDRCRVGSSVSRRRRERVLRRFRRSVDKWARRTGRPVSPGEMKAFDDAVRAIAD